MQAAKRDLQSLFWFWLGLLLLPPVTTALFNRKKTSNHPKSLKSDSLSESSTTNSFFKSNIKSLPLPDRTDSIVRHINSIEKAIKSNHLNLANLSYAKLIESIRQQNVKEGGSLDKTLKTINSEYDRFRQVCHLEYPSQFLPSSLKPNTDQENKEDRKVNKNLANITTKKINDNTTEITIELNEEVFLGTLKVEASANGNGEVDIKDITGFYGTKSYSPDNDYCVSFSDGYYENDTWQNGNIALVKENKLLYKKKLGRPHNCLVSNNGIVIACDWLNSDALTGRFLIFNEKGEEIFSNKTTANIGNCAISDDSQIVLFETSISDTNDSHKFFIIDVAKRKIVKTFERPASFQRATIDTSKKTIRIKDYRGFVFEIDFKGNQTNKKEYENQILTNGSVYDRLLFYEGIPDETKYKDPRYIQVLTEALGDNDALYSFNRDRILRKMGEYYEANCNINKAIKYWEKAIKINSKVGVKRKLNSLKRNSNGR